MRQYQSHHLQLQEQTGHSRALVKTGIVLHSIMSTGGFDDGQNTLNHFLSWKISQEDQCS